MNREISFFLSFTVGCAGEYVGTVEQYTHVASHIPECEPEYDECGNRIDDCPSCPLLLDLEGDGFEMSGRDDGVIFNARSPRHSPTLIAWTAPAANDGWLVHDVDGDGLISSGLELFGDFSRQDLRPGERANGFAALRMWDSNRDGVISADDDFEIFSKLRVWRDRNHDGVSQTEELSTLSAHGITALSIRYNTVKRIDEHGNIFQYSAKIGATSESVIGRRSFDVFLAEVHDDNHVAHPDVSDSMISLSICYTCDLEGCLAVSDKSASVWANFCSQCGLGSPCYAHQYSSVTERRNYCYYQYGA